MTQHESAVIRIDRKLVPVIKDLAERYGITQGEAAGLLIKAGHRQQPIEAPEAPARVAGPGVYAANAEVLADVGAALDLAREAVAKLSGPGAGNKGSGLRPAVRKAG